MSQVSTNVSYESLDLSEDTTRLPQWFNEYVLFGNYLRDVGVFEAIEQEFRLSRTGYQFIDVVVSAMAFFTAQPMYTGFRSMLDEAALGGWSSPLAAVAGRKKLPSQASMSRVLEEIPERMADDFVTKVLTRYSPEIGDEASEALLWRDCRANPWHGFAIDNRIQPLRRRGLPEGEDYPAPRRSVDKLGAESGYSGRKRADVQMARSVLEHMGSGRYMAMNYTSGDGQLCDDFALALTQIERWAEANGHQPEQCFLCIDGEQGGRPQMKAGLSSPVHFLTRLAYYAPLKDPAFLEKLHEQTWQKVADSMSGPTRWATEMGRYYEDDATARLVVSCFEPAGGKKTGAGYFVDGRQYEVYACDFAPCDFPASEVVSTYFGRAGRQENNFLREDRHFNLDHLFSDNSAGQKVVMAVGMWMRNLRPILSTEHRGNLESIDYEEAPRQTEEVDQLPLGVTSRDSSGTEPNRKSKTGHSPKGIRAPEQWWEMVAQTIDERLADKDGFEYDPSQYRIRCTNGKHLGLSGARKYGEDRVTFRFRITEASHCRDCPFRQQCTSSTLPSYRRELTISVCAPEQFTPSTPQESEPEPPGSDDVDVEQDKPGRSSQTTKMKGFGFDPTIFDDPDTAEAFQLREPMMVTTVLHNELRNHARRMQIDITVSSSPPTKPHPDYLIRSSARRQHRRQTWEERLAWNALSDGDSVDITVKAPPKIHAALTGSKAPPG